MKYLVSTILTLLITTLNLFAQESLLDEINSTSETTTYHMPAFKALRLLNLQTTKLASEKELVFYASHRFGSIMMVFQHYIV